MKYFELDDEEIQLLTEIEKGEWVAVKNLAKRKKELIQIARNTLNKTKNINLRLSEKDVQKLKAKAVKEGMPYQTLAASVLHKFANN